MYSAVVLCMLISIYTWFNDLNNSPEVIRHLKDIIPQWYIAAALTLKLCECCIKDVQNPHCTHVWVCAQCSDVWWTPAILIEIYHRENKTLYWQPLARDVLVFFHLQWIVDFRPPSIHRGFCHCAQKICLRTSNRLPVFTRPFYPAVSLMAAASSSTLVHSHFDGDF